MPRLLSRLVTPLRRLSTPSGSAELTQLSVKESRDAARLAAAVVAGPVLLRGALSDMILESHSLSYLNRCLRERRVPLEVSKGGGDYRDLYRDRPIPGRYFQADVPGTLGLLLDHILATEAEQEPAGLDSDVTLYLAQKDVHDVLPELALDARLLPLEGVKERLFQQSVWLGPRGTRTPLHCDPYFNLFCQVWGRKLLRIYAPEEKSKLRPFESGVLRNTSQLDTAHLPDCTSAPFLECTVEAGDILYIPRKFWHSVTALEASLSLSFWWT